MLYCFLASCSVAVVSLILQWLIYKDWLHDGGPERLVGTVLSALIAFIFVWHWQEGIRERRLDTERRMLVIAEMNDRIRNALQAIECITYANDEGSTKVVRDAVDRIDAALRGVSSEIEFAAIAERNKKKVARASGTGIGDF